MRIRTCVTDLDFSIGYLSIFVLFSHTSKCDKIDPIRWASPVHLELGPGWAIKLLARKKSGQIWLGPIWPGPVWLDPVRPARIFFCLQKAI